jgi:hypothetical protein
VRELVKDALSVLLGVKELLLVLDGVGGGVTVIVLETVPVIVGVSVSDQEAVGEGVPVPLCVPVTVIDGVGGGVTVLDFESETETVRLSESE